MINHMVVRNLLHRPVRTVLSVLAVAVEVAMILMIVGVSEGLLWESQRRSRGVGADIIIRPSTSSAAMSLSTADIPEKLVDKLAQTFPEIEIATGTTLTVQGNLQTVTGVDWERFERMSGGVRYFEGGPMEGAYDAIVDEVYAKYKKAKAGDKLELLNHEFRITGIVETGKMSRIFIPIETMQELMGWQGRLSQVYLKLHDPADTQQVIGKIRVLLPTYPIYALEELLSQASADLRSMSSQFINVIIGIAVIIGFMVVLLSMYTAILERTREIGILKSMGASRTYITHIVMRETIMVCAAGILAGYGFSYGAKAAVETYFPLVTVLILPSWLFWGAVIAVIGSFLGAFYPATKAARQDPIEALAYD